MARWALVGCEPSKPRSDFVQELARALSSTGVRVGGFAQLERRVERGEKGFELLRFSTGERAILALGGVAARGEQEAFCSYAFRLDGFALARRWIEEDALAEVLVLDGIGKLEAAGRGHAASLSFAMSLPAPKRVVIAVRSSQLFFAMERFGLEEPFASIELPAEEAERTAFVRAVGEPST